MIREKYSMFDPIRGANCEISYENAAKFIESAKQVEAQIQEDMNPDNINAEIARLQALKEKGETICE